MAVSHVALIHTLVTDYGFHAKTAKDGTLGFNLHQLTAAQVNDLVAFVGQFHLPVTVKRSGTGLRVTFGEPVPPHVILDYDYLRKAVAAHGRHGFNVQRLHASHLCGLFNLGFPVAIKRSGTGLRVTVGS